MKLGTTVLGWEPFASLDVWRRLQGQFVFEGCGWGPVRSRSEIVLEQPGMALHKFATEFHEGPVVLIVPAPIKRAYIWDLHPRVSAINQLVKAGCTVFMIEWAPPGEQDQLLGLADYADRFISLCLRAVQQTQGKRRPVFLASHSLGGVFTATYAALHPRAFAGLILIGTPLCFGARKDAFSPTISRHHLLFIPSGNVPGSFLNAVSLQAAPGTFAFARQCDLVASLFDPEALETHLRVERWTMDEMPLPRRLFREVSEWLYIEDRLIRGTLVVGKRKVHPQAITAPLLVIGEVESAVAPPESFLPFVAAVSSSSKKILWYSGDTGVALQHVGPLVGKNAHDKLWPYILDWIQQKPDGRSSARNVNPTCGSPAKRWPR